MKTMTRKEADRMLTEVVSLASSVFEDNGNALSDAVALAARLLDLDEHLREGGELPERWAAADVMQAKR